MVVFGYDVVVFGYVVVVDVVVEGGTEPGHARPRSIDVKICVWKLSSGQRTQTLSVNRPERFVSKPARVEVPLVVAFGSTVGVKPVTL